MMFRIKRLLLKLARLADLLATPFHRAFLFLWKGADISLGADVRPLQCRNIRFGTNVIVEKGCMLHATSGTTMRLGDNVIIQQYTHLLNYAGRGISIGGNTTINRYCILYGHGGLSIGSDCLVGPQCTFVPAQHKFDDLTVNIRQQGATCKGISIGDNVWLGARVTVLDGVSIGDGCVIGAGSVVTKSIPSNSIAVGVPAKVIRARGHDHSPHPHAIPSTASLIASC